eukprot:3430332-Amphidinium_carterae.1
MAFAQHGIAFVSILCAAYHSTIHLPHNILHVNDGKQVKGVYTQQRQDTFTAQPISCAADTTSLATLSRSTSSSSSTSS